MSRQDAIGVGNGVLKLGTQRTEKRRRMRPDAAPAPQTQDYFLLMWPNVEKKEECGDRRALGGTDVDGGWGPWGPLED